MFPSNDVQIISVESEAEIEALPADTEAVLVKDFSDAKAQALTRLCALRVLFGDGNSSLSDLGLEHLGTLSSLESLDLEWTVFSDEGLRHLERLTNLRWLDLTGCSGFSETGLRALHSTLPVCEIEPYSSVNRTAGTS